jgi:integrase
MKSGRPWEGEVPEVVMPLLCRYLNEFRPWVMQQHGEKHNFLWVAKRGKPFETSYLGSWIALAMTEATGVRVSPHLFRDAAATTLARASPESAKLIKPILAHRCFETAERHYIHAGSIDAGRTYAAIIRDRRKNS